MKKITVNLRDRYPIYYDKLDRLPFLLNKKLSPSQVFVITNSTVQKIYRDRLKAVLPKAGILVIPDGEEFKTLPTASKIYSQLLMRGAGRDCLIVGFGGGVVGDLAGFVAATYMRGVPFVQIPTTLLAMTDSSVGGKVAVNHALGKNIIGSFYQPKFVLIDPYLLKTLPERELICGLAEITKYGLILDKQFFQWLETNYQQILLQEKSALQHAIMRSCALKARIVEQDEKESGVRMILNFGHTWAHAFEKISGYRFFKHGEAVLFGMLASCHLSCERAMLPPKDFLRISRLLSSLLSETVKRKEVRRFFSDLSWSETRTAIQSDKKIRQKTVHWVLLNKIGKAEIVTGINERMAAKSLNAVKKYFHDRNNVGYLWISM
jgi:3-dehydroquinate synthase